jgi:hypothetical protein
MPMTTEEIQAIAVRAAEAVLENKVPEEASTEVAPDEEKPCPNLQPMAEWIKGETPGTCRPCILAPVVQWYWQELKEQGNEEVAAELQAEVDVLEEDNAEQVMALCKDLDEIKAAAPPELRQRLEEFDCSIQSFDPNEFSEEVQAGDSPSSSQPLPHSSGTESISQ